MRDDENLADLLPRTLRKANDEISRCSPRRSLHPGPGAGATCPGSRRTSRAGRCAGLHCTWSRKLTRHAGHADIVRESIDRATMYELMAAHEEWPETEFHQAVAAASDHAGKEQQSLPNLGSHRAVAASDRRKKSPQIHFDRNVRQHYFRGMEFSEPGVTPAVRSSAARSGQRPLAPRDTEYSACSARRTWSGSTRRSIGWACTIRGSSSALRGPRHRRASILRGLAVRLGPLDRVLHRHRVRRRPRPPNGWRRPCEPCTTPSRAPGPTAPCSTPTTLDWPCAGTLRHRGVGLWRPRIDDATLAPLRRCTKVDRLLRRVRPGGSRALAAPTCRPPRPRRHDRLKSLPASWAS